tara:strand:- start:61 stop:837 length:777 start_codon:yes stop_codon:yes gene_type:complete
MYTNTQSLYNNAELSMALADAGVSLSTIIDIAEKRGGEAALNAVNMILYPEPYREQQAIWYVLEQNALRQEMHINALEAQIHAQQLKIENDVLKEKLKQQNVIHKQTEIIYKLSCSLEELFTGTTKRIKITRNLQWSVGPIQKILEVNIQPGLKPGTKIRFSNEGDELSNGSIQDIIFEITKKPHNWFNLNGDNLIYKAKLTDKQAKKGVKITIPTLDGRKLQTKTGRVYNGENIVFIGEGMPKNNGTQGNLIIEIII